MGYENWMKDNWEIIKNRFIWNVILPGTHGSGVFSADNTIGVRNQSQDIGSQLKGGIRSFDIRIMRRPRDNNYIMHHSGIWANSQLFETALEQMKEFAHSHPQEVFILGVDGGYNGNLTDGDKTDIYNMINKYIGNYIIHGNKSDSEYTLEKIQKSGKNIIVVSDFDIINSDCDEVSSDLFWHNTNNNILKDTWVSKQSNWIEADFLDFPKWIKSHLKESYRDRGVKFHYASCMLGNFDVRGAACNRAIPGTCECIGSFALDSTIREKMNIFAIDFYQENDNLFMKTILEVYKSLTPPTTRRNGTIKVISGAHKHGYMYRFTGEVVKRLKDKNYTLETNFWYSKGDYFEVRSGSGIISPDLLKLILKNDGFNV